MGYVLVPVPTEYVLDVMRWVLFRTGDDDADELDADTAAQLLSEVDDATRRLLFVVARATVKNDPPRLSELAAELGQEAKTVRDTITALNDQQLLDDGRDLLELRADASVGVHGKHGTVVFVSMRPDLAPLVRSVERSSNEPDQ